MSGLGPAADLHPAANRPLTSRRVTAASGSTKPLHVRVVPQGAELAIGFAETRAVA